MYHKRMLCLALLLIHTSADAHLLKLFAYVEGNTIHGSTYFAGGAGVEGAAITLTSLTDKEQSNLKSDAKGEFLFTASRPDDYKIQANTGEGHQAEWLIKADTFNSTSDTTDSSNQSYPASSPATSTKTDQQLALLVEQAVAKQIGPLRESLQRSDDRARLSDILGGVGFIFGLAGIALWWRSKQTPGKK
ncbi:MAG: hypothetical protein FHK82_08560 [Sedimenticola thiotaurini]|uniref:Carboxypeptidase regulatory-like domain-containing protein n=1 Tax=Sedimenticola thiotaurini TaxID=1543721 RepID=A0A558D2Z0_9GAMM|nr:MAG: hypothetical protein FHK82_08560 [Sedimenticola thiotaurini]